MDFKVRQITRDELELWEGMLDGKHFYAGKWGKNMLPYDMRDHLAYILQLAQDGLTYREKNYVEPF